MKRTLISLLVALCLCMSMALCVQATSVNVPDALVIDNADLLSDAEELALYMQMDAIGQALAVQMAVITESSIGDADADQYVEDLYDSMALGCGENRDGVLMMVSMDPWEYRILTNGFAGDAITDFDIEMICDNIQDYMVEGDYAAAFETFASDCEFYLDGYVNGYDFDLVATLVICTVFGLIVALITVLIMKGQLRGVRRQNLAEAYVRGGSMRLTEQRDLYLYRHVSRTKKNNDSSSSGGSRSSSGGSRSVGGRSF